MTEPIFMLPLHVGTGLSVYVFYQQICIFIGSFIEFMSPAC